MTTAMSLTTLDTESADSVIMSVPPNEMTDPLRDLKNFVRQRRQQMGSLRDELTTRIDHLWCSISAQCDRLDHLDRLLSQPIATRLFVDETSGNPLDRQFQALQLASVHSSVLTGRVDEMIDYLHEYRSKTYDYLRKNREDLRHFSVVNGEVTVRATMQQLEMRSGGNVDISGQHGDSNNSQNSKQSSSGPSIKAAIKTGKKTLKYDPFGGQRAHMVRMAMELHGTGGQPLDRPGQARAGVRRESIEGEMEQMHSMAEGGNQHAGQRRHQTRTRNERTGRVVAEGMSYWELVESLREINESAVRSQSTVGRE